jgi:hypothetical protein
MKLIAFQLYLDTSMFIVKPDFPKGDEDWLRLLHKQESLHQLEVEKWHELLGTATHLLRQVSHFIHRSL